MNQHPPQIVDYLCDRTGFYANNSADGEYDSTTANSVDVPPKAKGLGRKILVLR